MKKHKHLFAVFGGVAVLIATVVYAAAAGDRLINNPNQDRDIVFAVNDGGTPTEVMFVDGPTARVGVGTSSPQKQLDVVNDVRAFRSGSPSQFVDLHGGTGSTNPGLISDITIDLTSNANSRLSISSAGGLSFFLGASQHVRVNSSGIFEAQVPINNCSLTNSNICSGEFTATTSALGGSSACTTITTNPTMMWGRIGHYMTTHFQIDTTGCGTDWNFEITLPNGDGGTMSTNFTSNIDVAGIGARSNDNLTAGKNEISCRAIVSTPRAICYGTSGNDATPAHIVLNFTIQ